MARSVSVVCPDGVAINGEQPEKSLWHKWQASKFHNAEQTVNFSNYSNPRGR
jgi:hypothetical protein